MTSFELLYIASRANVPVDDIVIGDVVDTPTAVVFTVKNASELNGKGHTVSDAYRINKEIVADGIIEVACNTCGGKDLAWREGKFVCPKCWIPEESKEYVKKLFEEPQPDSTDLSGKYQKSFIGFFYYPVDKYQQRIAKYFEAMNAVDARRIIEEYLKTHAKDWYDEWVAAGSQIQMEHDMRKIQAFIINEPEVAKTHYEIDEELPKSTKNPPQIKTRDFGPEQKELEQFDTDEEDDEDEDEEEEPDSAKKRNPTKKQLKKILRKLLREYLNEIKENVIMVSSLKDDSVSATFVKDDDMFKIVIIGEQSNNKKVTTDISVNDLLDIMVKLVGEAGAESFSSFKDLFNESILYSLDDLFYPDEEKYERDVEDFIEKSSTAIEQTLVNKYLTRNVVNILTTESHSYTISVEFNQQNLLLPVKIIVEDEGGVSFEESFPVDDIAAEVYAVAQAYPNMDSDSLLEEALLYIAQNMLEELEPAPKEESLQKKRKRDYILANLDDVTDIFKNQFKDGKTSYIWVNSKKFELVTSFDELRKHSMQIKIKIIDFNENKFLTEAHASLELILSEVYEALYDKQKTKEKKENLEFLLDQAIKDFATKVMETEETKQAAKPITITKEDLYKRYSEMNTIENLDAYLSASFNVGRFIVTVYPEKTTISLYVNGKFIGESKELELTIDVGYASSSLIKHVGLEELYKIMYITETHNETYQVRKISDYDLRVLLERAVRRIVNTMVLTNEQGLKNIIYKRVAARAKDTAKEEKKSYVYTYKEEPAIESIKEFFENFVYIGVVTSPEYGMDVPLFLKSRYSNEMGFCYMSSGNDCWEFKIKDALDKAGIDTSTKIDKSNEKEIYKKFIKAVWEIYDTIKTGTNLYGDAKKELIAKTKEYIKKEGLKSPFYTKRDVSGDYELEPL